jgi:hypothetical protein
MKRDAEALVRAYALKIFSGESGAPLKIQQKFHDQFMKKHDALARKYPDVDLSSEAFWRELKRRAAVWWVSRAMRGPSVDW